MFYIENRGRPHGKIVLGSVEFKRTIHNYFLDIRELSTDQYQTFKGALFAFDLHGELEPNDWSDYVVRCSPDE